MLKDVIDDGKISTDRMKGGRDVPRRRTTSWNRVFLSTAPPDTDDVIAWKPNSSGLA